MLQPHSTSFKTRLRKSLAPSVMAAVVVAFYPGGAYAATTDGAQQQKQPATAETTGPQKPNGADAKDYTQNPDGTWTNGTYTWDPATKKTTPNQQQDYSYNLETQKWDTKDHIYDPATGKYVPNTKTGSDTTGNSSGGVSDAGLSSDTTGTADGTKSAKAAGDAFGADTSTAEIGGTGPNSSNKIQKDQDVQGFFGNFYDADISNDINSNAKSGDASIIGNTSAGSATSGDAMGITNLINMLQSQWGWGSDLVTFVADIYGDVFGDITLDPSKIQDQNNETEVSDNLDYNLDVNSEENASINNDIDVNAQSGNATVSGNTKAGDATTGDAAAIANLVNLISSSISAGESFVGALNIHGKLNGDILLPKGVLDQLIAANGGSTTIDKNVNANLTTETNQTINNDVTTDAHSGNATVANNTSAGSATTGDATNKLTILNLTGRQVTGENSMLVFVNVLGSWVGMIVDAPQGSTAAALGGGLTTNKSLDADIDVNAESNQTINNDVDLAATTGDANVTGNTTAGSAVTGDASTSANIANVTDSNFDLGGFFGILFINVFDSWIGSFGVDTAAGEQPAQPSEQHTQKQNHAPAVTVTTEHKASSTGDDTAQPAALAASQYLPSYAYASGNITGNTNAPANGTVERQLPATIAVSNDQSGGNGAAAGIGDTEPSANQGWILSAFGVLIGASLIGSERFLSSRQARRRAASQAA